MGCAQSKDHSNASDTEMFLDSDTSEDISTLRRCSTFINPLYPNAAATSLIRSGKCPKPRRRSMCRNYDPAYLFWKNSFENEILRTPRKVLPRIGKNKRVYDITGILAGQQTLKGFPYCTILTKQMHCEKQFTDEEFTSSYEENSSSNPLVDTQSTPIVLDSDTNNGKVNEKEISMNEIAKVLPEIKSSNLGANAERTTATNESSLTLKKAPKRLKINNFRRKFFNCEYNHQERHFIDLHDLGGCYYAF